MKLSKGTILILKLVMYAHWIVQIMKLVTKAMCAYQYYIISVLLFF